MPYIFIYQHYNVIFFKCIVEKVNIRRDICEVDDSIYFRGDTL